MFSEPIQERRQQVLYDQKWKKFLRRSWPFQYIPFIEFVLGAGSMALGNATPESDFDVIVGARFGRIFTARFFCFLTFSLPGWWVDHRLNKVKDRFCFNHFVTENSFRLSPPYDIYGKNLYQKLVPILGKPEIIDAFLAANRDWVGVGINYRDDLRHLHKESGAVKFFFEKILGGRLGNQLERILKAIQIRKIERSLEKERQYKPRIKYDDDELEFHWY